MDGRDVFQHLAGKESPECRCSEIDAAVALKVKAACSQGAAVRVLCDPESGSRTGSCCSRLCETLYDSLVRECGERLVP